PASSYTASSSDLAPYPAHSDASVVPAISQVTVSVPVAAAISTGGVTTPTVQPSEPAARVEAKRETTRAAMRISIHRPFRMRILRIRLRAAAAHTPCCPGRAATRVPGGLVRPGRRRLAPRA